MHIEKETLGIVLRNYRVCAKHAGTVVLVPSLTGGEEREEFLARGILLVESNLSSICAIRCEWLGGVQLDDTSLVRVGKEDLPGFLDEGIPPDAEVYCFDLPSAEPTGPASTFFLARLKNGFEDGNIVVVGHVEERSAALGITDFGSYFTLCHLAEEIEKESRHRDTIQSPPMGQE